MQKHKSLPPCIHWGWGWLKHSFVHLNDHLGQGIGDDDDDDDDDDNADDDDDDDGDDALRQMFLHTLPAGRAILAFLDSGRTFV